MLYNPKNMRSCLREIVREWGLMNAHPCVADVTLVQGHALIEVEEAGELSVKQLASRLRLDHSSASRLAGRIAAAKLVSSTPGKSDARERLLCLTPYGRATLAKIHRESNLRVTQALELLSSDEQSVVASGLKLYARALSRARQQQGFKIRPIQAKDDKAVARIIRTVMPEYGATGPGCALHDAEVDFMHRAYSQKGSAYFVVEQDSVVVGGGGVAALQGGDGITCELKKMYFLPTARGLGLGEKLLRLCLDTAALLGYHTCYLETLSKMVQAQQLYQKLGFHMLQAPRGETGHSATDRWYEKELPPLLRIDDADVRRITPDV